jgi:putative hydrolase of the HAD superfamily
MSLRHNLSVCAKVRLFDYKPFIYLCPKSNFVDILAFDADDTLWANEPYFRDAEQYCFELLKNYGEAQSIESALVRTEIKNISIYGYGIKGFVLSMLETAIEVSGGTVPVETISAIIAVGRDMINKPVELLPGVEDVLKQVKGKYRLVVATKGDLLDQERKLTKSGLLPYFHHIEIMSEKKEMDYVKLMKHLDVRPNQFTMVGNAMKSDILPVLALGGRAFHVPFHTTWALEMAEAPIDNPNFHELGSISELITYL